MSSSISISKTPKRKPTPLIEDSQHQSKSPLKLGTSPKPNVTFLITPHPKKRLR